MRKTQLLIGALAFLMLAPAALHANHYSDFYVIPVAGRTPGVNNTQWMSDVAIYNFSGSPLSVQAIFVESGERIANNVSELPLPELATTSIPPGGSVILNDIVKNTGRTTVLGSILLQGSQPFAVTSRSYSMTPSGHTVGQTVVPARDFLENAAGTTNNALATAYIPGLIANDRFRTNLGFIAATAENSAGMAIEVTLRGANGQNLGAKTFLIPSDPFGSLMHVQFSSRAVTASSFDAAGADFRITAGSGAVVPYASVIDNVTADAVYVSGQFPVNTPFGKSGVPSVFRTLFNRYSTNQ